MYNNQDDRVMNYLSQLNGIYSDPLASMETDLGVYRLAAVIHVTKKD